MYQPKVKIVSEHDPWSRVWKCDSVLYTDINLLSPNAIKHHFASLKNGFSNPYPWIDCLHEFAREQFVWLKQFGVAHRVACCHWTVCNSCLIKTVRVAHCVACCYWERCIYNFWPTSPGIYNFGLLVLCLHLSQKVANIGTHCNRSFLFVFINKHIYNDQKNSQARKIRKLFICLFVGVPWNG